MTSCRTWIPPLTHHHPHPLRLPSSVLFLLLFFFAFCRGGHANYGTTEECAFPVTGSGTCYLEGTNFVPEALGGTNALLFGKDATAMGAHVRVGSLGEGGGGLEDGAMVVLKYRLGSYFLEEKDNSYVVTLLNRSGVWSAKGNLLTASLATCLFALLFVRGRALLVLSIVCSLIPGVVLQADVNDKYDVLIDVLLPQRPFFVSAVDGISLIADNQGILNFPCCPRCTTYGIPCSGGTWMDDDVTPPRCIACSSQSGCIKDSAEEECIGDLLVCKECAIGYYLEDGMCEACSIQTGCSTTIFNTSCIMDDLLPCRTCDVNYTLTADGLCLPPKTCKAQPNCLSSDPSQPCLDSNQQFCVTCDVGYLAVQGKCTFNGGKKRQQLLKKRAQEEAEL